MTLSRALARSLGRRWEALLLDTVAVFWLSIWRVPVWSHDDLGFANRSERPHGGIV